VVATSNREGKGERGGKSCRKTMTVEGQIELQGISEKQLHLPWGQILHHGLEPRHARHGTAEEESSIVGANHQSLIKGMRETGQSEYSIIPPDVGKQATAANLPPETTLQTSSSCFPAQSPTPNHRTMECENT